MKRISNLILFLILILLSSGFISTNVPLDHWSYEAIDKLIGQGLIDCAMISTKPVTRIEMARHIAEAIQKSQQLNEKNEITSAILNRLTREFRAELITIGLIDDISIESFIKPVEDPYIRYVFADERPVLENQRGDTFYRNSNYRLGFISRMKFCDTVAFYFHPEFVDSSSGPESNVDLIEGYGKITFAKLEIELGKDSLWWGPGYHGSMLMSNNAEPFKIIKVSNPRPIQLPWIFRHLGPFKAVWFLSELEKNRTVPKAKLTGLRFNFKPHPIFEVGLSRTIIFDGSGRPSVGLKDYLDMFWPQSEQAENNQLAGFDVSLLLPFDKKMPVKSIRLYADLAGEDEAGGLPAKWGTLLGMQLSDILLTARTDLRIEYANNRVAGFPNVFYNHGLYQYTYKGQIIGHHMGTDAHDLFLRLTHYLNENVIIGIEYDKQVGRQVGSTPIDPFQTAEQLGFDLTFLSHSNCQIQTAYRFERLENYPLISGDNHIFQLLFTYNF